MYKDMCYKTLNLKKCMIAALAVILCAACGQKKEINPPTEFAQYIKAYTGGTITSTSSIRITLSDEALGSLTNNNEYPDKLFDFSPSLNGQAHWLSATEIEFVPEDGALKPGRIYNAEFKLGRIVNVDESRLESFDFSFRVLPKALSIEVEGVEISAEDSPRASVSGILHSNTAISAEQAKSYIKFKYPGIDNTEAELRIEGGESGRQFRFTIAGLGRDNKENSLVLTADGSKDGFERTSQTEVKMPAQGRFHILSSAMRSNGDGHYVELRFSEPLAESASEAGMISVDGAASFNLEINNNIARVHLNNVNVYDGVTVTLAPYVKSVDGTSLGRAYSQRYHLEDIAPSVSLCFNGHILPDNSMLVLPFITRGLSAVDVSVIKIFESNVLSFIQSNGLEGGDQIRRFGRLIYKNTFQICAHDAIDASNWVENTLDLSSMFKQEPGAIYRIRFSFKKDYTIYGTVARAGNAGMVNMGKVEGEDVWDEPSPYIYEGDYDWSEYNWEERNDPSKTTFYMDSGRYPVCNLISSNIGIVAKKAHGNKLWVSVADIIEARPVSDAQLVAYNYQLQEIGRTKTDSDGFAELDCKGRPFIVKAFKGSNESSGGQSAAYLKVTDAEEISLSRFDTGGVVRSLGLKGFVYGERGVWRPGDTLHLSLMIEGDDQALPENHPVIAELYNARGQFHSKMVCGKGVRGLYTFNMPTNANDPTGIWNAYFKYGGSTFHKALHIETVKPNRLKVNVSFGSDILVAEEAVSIDLSSSWLTGTAASNLKFSSSMTLSKLNRPFKGYENYVFNNPLKSFKSFTKEFVSGKMNGNGKFTGMVSIPAAQEAPGMLNASIATQVFESGGDASINTVNLRYAPFKSFTGIKLESDSDKGYDGFPQYETDTDLRFPVIVLSPDGKPVAGHNLEYAIYKLKWSWWWENNQESLDAYVHGSDACKVAAGELVSAAQARAVPFKLKYPEYGRYLVYVRDKVSGHATGGIIYVDWPSWRGRSSKSDPSALQMLTFSTDKKSYEPGEEAVVFIPSAAGGRAMVSLENGSTVISRQWIATKEEGTKFKIKITKDMAPNFYVHITLLQPHRKRVNDLPIRMYGVQPVLVQDKNSRLEPELSVPEVLRPQQEFALTVKEKHGKPMAYTIAIVDDGLLDLTNYKTADPWGRMNEREALGVHSWDLYDDVIGAYSGKFSPIAGIGGDEDKIVGGRKENRFNPVVKFLGPFNLDKGSATHKITLPMYVGSVRFMVVACDTKKYGNCEKTVPVRTPLMLLSSLPASIACGETLSLPVNVFAMEKDVRNVQVNVKAEGALSILGSSSQSLSFTGDGDKISNFRLAASSREGSAKITVTASCGRYKAQEVLNIEVLNNQPDLSSREGILLKAGESHILGGSGSPDFDPDTYSATLQASSFPAVDYLTMFDNMYHYRYICSEQILSKGITALYLKDLLAMADDGSVKKGSGNAGRQKNGAGNASAGKSQNDKALDGKRSYNAKRIELADAMVNETLRELYGRQTSSGGFVCWPGQGSANEWVTAMAGHFMAKAVSSGYNVNKNVFESWEKYELQQANAYMRMERKLDDLMQAYRLYSLALAGKPADGAMNRLKAADNISVQAAWRLAAAYALAGKKSIATELIERLNTNAESNSEAWYWFGSQARDEAMMLESALLADDLMRAMPLAARLENEFNSWNHNTQFCAYASVALNLLAQKIQKAPIDLAVNHVEGNEASNNGMNGTDRTSGIRKNARGNNSEHIKTTANLAELDVTHFGPGAIEVRNNGKADVYISLTRSGKPAISYNTATYGAGQKYGNNIAAYLVPETSSNLKLGISYLDMNGRIINPARLKQGEEFSVEINVQSVNNISAVSNLALDMAVPSGWEIFNERLFTQGTDSENCTYKDIRDNRIVWYFNLPKNGVRSFRTRLRAAFAGEFVLPAIQCQAMYDPQIHANTASGSAIVAP